MSHPPAHTMTTTSLLTAPRQASSARTSVSGSIAHSVLEPARPSTTNSSTRKPTATGQNRTHGTSITVVEPIREKLVPTPPPKPSRAKKTLQALGDGLGMLAYMLCFCCVLSGEQRPQAKKTSKGYYYQYDEGFAEMEGTRVRKVESSGQTSVGSKPTSERVGRVR